MSVGHSQWQAQQHDGSGSVCVLVFPECVRVLGMPELFGRQRASANIHSTQQAALTSLIAMRQRVQSIACNTTQHPLKKTPIQSKTACNIPLFHCHYLSPTRATYPPPKTSPKTHFHNTSRCASAQREYLQSRWIDPRHWHVLSFVFVVRFLHLYSVSFVKLDSEGCASGQDLSQCQTGAMSLGGVRVRKIRVVIFPERRKKKQRSKRDDGCELVVWDQPASVLMLL